MAFVKKQWIFETGCLERSGRGVPFCPSARRSRHHDARGGVGELALADRRVGPQLRSTTPNELCGEIHNRMPVILKPETWPAWLGEEPADLEELNALLAPYPAGEMICWPVSTRVGNVRNNDADLIEPLAAVTAH